MLIKILDLRRKKETGDRKASKKPACGRAGKKAKVKSYAVMQFYGGEKARSEL